MDMGLQSDLPVSCVLVGPSKKDYMMQSVTFLSKCHECMSRDPFQSYEVARWRYP